MQGASEQCMQATEMDFSAPITPSLMVTTRRRLSPQGTSFSFLHAVTQALHSMQRSASQRNFIRAMAVSSGRLDLAKRGLGFLHVGDRIESVGRDRVGAFAEHVGLGAGRVLAALINALEPAG